MREKKSMFLEDLSMYIEDLKRMGLIYEHIENGKKFYKLTDQGIKSGLYGYLKN